MCISFLLVYTCTSMDWLIHSYQAWASVLLVQLYRAMRGTSDGENSHAFLYMYVSINIIFLSLGVYRIVTNNGKYGNFTESYV